MYVLFVGLICGIFFLENIASIFKALFPLLLNTFYKPRNDEILGGISLIIC